MVAKVFKMADALIRYAKKHCKLTFAVVAAIFSAGGMFAVARADMNTVKNGYEKHSKRLDNVEKQLESKHAKLDAMAEDLQLIKTHLINRVD